MLPNYKQHNRISVLLGLTGIVAAVGFGCGGDNSGTSTTPAPTTGSPSAGAMSGGAVSGGAMPGNMGGPTTAGAGLPGAAGTQPNAAAGAAGTTVAGSGPPPGARPDPFRPWFNTIPPPPAVLTLVDPLRIATPDSSPPVNPPGVDVQEVPSRRVAGILTGNGIYALFDDGMVVKPGDLVDDYRVTMITKNAVTLKKKVNNQTFTQVIPLSDAGSAPSSQMSSPGSSAPRGGPSGMFPGRGGGGGGGLISPGSG
jgi:hypothetical protein